MAFIGEITLFTGNFAPNGWLTCEGQSLPVNQYQALYSIIGNAFGGNSTTFNLPDLRGAFPTQYNAKGGATPGGNYTRGQTGGTQSFTITQNNLPPHTHTIVKGTGNNLRGGVDVAATLNVSNTETGSSAVPSAGNSIAGVTDLGGSGGVGIYNNAQPNTALNQGTITVATSNNMTFDPTGLTLTPYGTGPIPISTVPNFVAMMFIICVTDGDYPPRP